MWATAGVRGSAPARPRDRFYVSIKQDKQITEPIDWFAEDRRDALLRDPLGSQLGDRPAPVSWCDAARPTAIMRRVPGSSAMASSPAAPPPNLLGLVVPVGSAPGGATTR